MVGIVVAAHLDFGDALIRAAEGIVGKMERVVPVAFHYNQDPEVIRARFIQAIEDVDEGDGVLVFTDMFGGTPTNMALPLTRRGRVEVMTGVNLPMLLKAQALRWDMPLRDLTVFLRDYGAKNILIAAELFPRDDDAEAQKA